MNKAYQKDIWRTIKKSKKRFISIMIITMLGVTMLTGLKAGCVDLRNSADSFYDQQNLFDIQVVSTLGLNDYDIEALQKINGIRQIDGSYEETVYLKEEGIQQSIALKALSTQGMNSPYVIEGILPTKDNEIAVSKKYQKNTEVKLHDTITLDVNSDSHLKQKKFKITAIVQDAMDISVSDGLVAFRSTSTVNDTFFVHAKAFDNEIYTSIYITLQTTKNMMSYSDEYNENVKSVISEIESKVKTQREQARYDEIVKEAKTEYTNGKHKAEDAFAKADMQFKNSKTELLDGKSQLQKGWDEVIKNQTLLNENKSEASTETEKAFQQIQDNITQLNDGKNQLDTATKQLQNGKQQIEEAKISLNMQQTSTMNQVTSSIAKLDQALHSLQQKQVESQSQLSILKGEVSTWPDLQERTLKEAVSSSYLPLFELNQQIESIQEQHKLQPNDTLSSQLEILLKQQVDIESSILESYTSQQYNFEQQLNAEIAPKIKFIEEQIASLNQMDQDYALRKLKLEEQKNELQLLPQRSSKQIITGAKQSAQETVLTETKTEQNNKQKDLQNQFTQANAEITEKEQEWSISQQHLTESYRVLQQNQDFLSNSLLLLNQQQDYANQQFVEADKELKKGKQTLQANEETLKQGEQDLLKQLKSYEQSKTKTQKELTKAYKAIEQIDMTKWYVQDRNTLNSYTSVQSDASSIETVGNAFPIVFLIVAILISLTTITRMVEEERGLIGTYKALGFSDISIYGKYLIYAFSACMIGGILGDICGFILLPKFLFTIFQVLYQLPVYEISFNYVYGIGGVQLFVVGIVSATIIACRVELTQMPAILMRPKAPRAGSRMILEHIPSLWKKLSFLNKVTMRNLFRFKKRMFMTIGGIMGCTALILCGFAIKDSVTELMPGQYERIYKYDFMAVVAENRYHTLEQELKKDSQISDYTGVRIDSVKVKTNKNEQEETMQLMVIPNQESITQYIGLEDTNGKSFALKDGIYITQNASQVLGFKQGDDIYIQDSNLIQQKVQVNKLVQNYLGNTVYMTQHTYEQLFQPYKANGFLAHFSKTCPNQTQYADDFRDKDDVLSSISVQFLKEQFAEAFSLINAVVYLITIMAAGLAFVVLFTLSTTNISERERELATIKVLGFFDNEVHLYVNKETVILTLLGILCGLPLGRVLSGMLTSALNMPSIHFAVSVYPISYVYAALLSLCFACIVNLITNRTLNRINMVEALKSIE